MKKIIYNIALLGSVLCTSLAQGQVVLEALDAPNGKCLERVYDRNYGDGVHNFVYCAVQGPNGKKWLNLNLGAEYAREGSPYFNPEVQPTDYNDWKAFGSLFQEGRKADGHEIVEYYHNVVRPHGQMPVQVGELSHYWFVRRASEITTEKQHPYNSTSKYVVNDDHWNTDDDKLELNKMWVGQSLNNPCPQGYRVMNNQDVESLFSTDVNKMIMQGGLLTPSIVRNIDYPFLYLVTAPTVRDVPLDVYGNSWQLSGALNLDGNISNGRGGTSTLWMIAPSFTYNYIVYYDSGNWKLYQGEVLPPLPLYSGFDRGIFIRPSGSLLESYPYGYSKNIHVSSSMAIRCVEN